MACDHGACSVCQKAFYPKLFIQAEWHTRILRNKKTLPCRAIFWSCHHKAQMRVRWKTSWRPALLPTMSRAQLKYLQVSCSPPLAPFTCYRALCQGNFRDAAFMDQASMGSKSHPYHSFIVQLVMPYMVATHVSNACHILGWAICP